MSAVMASARNAAATASACATVEQKKMERRSRGTGSSGVERSGAAGDPIPARPAALKTMAARELKEQWRELFGTEPPP